jgi:outer membrane protein assembly factor BamD (BamD/ComL family)
MTNDEKRTLKVFLCHASGDKPQVRNLYKRLSTEGVDAWLDQEKLLPGQDWRVEIPRAVQEADVVVVCLSNKSITKEGYIQKEIKFALDSADEKPDGTIFLIPARLEDCPVPEKLSRWQWVDLFEDNGYLKLLSSLKLRADKVGAVISPASYQEGDAETERRLDQYYTEGLAAFYTEDWDKACQRFQLILREKPNHKIAIEKLEEAERQRDLAKLYAQTTNAIQAQDWQAAIRSLEDLLKRTPDYKDSALLYKNAKKQKQLKELYAEAKKLHAAEKWQAVVKVFDQILSIESNHPDSDGLLPSAQKEVAELKRLSDLNELYAQAVREMDMGKWYEARALLEQVHKAQTGFLETERLLRKTEDEILKIEESNARVNQVNTLYEQAHGLLRAKNWRQALDKMNEIQKLDSQFEDKDGIVEKVKAELEREEQEAQKQNQLAAMYADAVRLLKEGKYQESLEKWDEVKAIDPKYPDRQWVQKNARKRLAVTDKSRKPVIYKSRAFTVGIFSFLLFAGLTYIIAINIPVTLFNEDFDDGAANGIIHASENGQIIADETGNNVYEMNNFSTPNYRGIDFGYITWENYEFKFRMKFLNLGDSQAVIEFRRSETGYSKYVVSVESQRVALYYTTPLTDWTLIKYVGYQIKRDEWYSFSIQVQENEIKVYVNDVLVIQAEDNHHSAGSINIQVGPYTHMQLDNLKVISLEK